MRVSPRLSGRQNSARLQDSRLAPCEYAPAAAVSRYDPNEKVWTSYPVPFLNKQPHTLAGIGGAVIARSGSAIVAGQPLEDLFLLPGASREDGVAATGGDICTLRFGDFCGTDRGGGLPHRAHRCPRYSYDRCILPRHKRVRGSGERVGRVGGEPVGSASLTFAPRGVKILPPGARMDDLEPGLAFATHTGEMIDWKRGIWDLGKRRMDLIVVSAKNAVAHSRRTQTLENCIRYACPACKK